MKKLFYLFALVSAIVMSSCSSGSKLEFQVAAANKQCPVAAGEGMTLTKMCIEDNNVVCVCEVDEDVAGFNVSIFDDPALMNQVKPGVVQAISSGSDGQKLVELVKDANYNIVYRLIGSPSNNQVEIVIYPHEL